MALTKCADCGHDMSTAAKACPNCGAPKPKGPSNAPAIALGVVGLLVVLFIMAATGKGGSSSPKAQDRRAIELCWSDQKRQSLDPAAQRFVAGACERLEERFRSTYGHSP